MYSGVADTEFQQHTVAKDANEYWVKAALAGADLRERLAKYLGASVFAPLPRHCRVRCNSLPFLARA